MTHGAVKPPKTAVNPTAPPTTASGEPLPLHHGVYFKPLGETVVTGSDWTVCTTINLSKFENVHVQLQNQITEVEKQLTQAKETLQELSRLSDGEASTSYESRIELFNKILSSLDKLAKVVQRNLLQYHTTIRTIDDSLKPPAGSRNRRGLIDVVSRAGKALFGFSTEQDVDTINERIAQLSDSSENITHALDQQFSYIKDVASQVLTEGSQIQSLGLDISDLTRIIGKIKGAASALRLPMMFTELCLGVVSSLTMINDEITQSQQAIRSLQNVVTEAKQGSLSWELFTREVFEQLLASLHTQLPAGWSLLYNVGDHYSYLNYAQVTTHPSPTGLHLCVELPIVEASSRYQLFEAISSPVVHPNFPQHIYFMYGFTSPYLAMQTQGTEILTLASWKQSDHEYFSRGAQGQYLCQGTDPQVCP